MNKNWAALRSVIGPSFALVILSACGGTDAPGKCYSPTFAVCDALGVDRSFPETIQSSSPAGLYKGVTSNGRVIAGLVLDDKSFYAVYSGINNPSLTGGAIQGTVQAYAGSFSVTDAIDVNVEGLGTRVATVSGTYAEKQFINGSIIYPASNQSISFTANYDPDYETIPNLSTIAGNYVGTSRASIGSETVTLQIGSGGAISGNGSSGCTFSGTIKPRTRGNAYVTDVTFGAAPCAYPGATFTGISYFDRVTNLSYTVVSLAGQTAKFILVATKQ